MIFSLVLFTSCYLCVCVMGHTAEERSPAPWTLPTTFDAALRSSFIFYTERRDEQRAILSWAHPLLLLLLLGVGMKWKGQDRVVVAAAATSASKTIYRVRKRSSPLWDHYTYPAPGASPRREKRNRRRRRIFLVKSRCCVLWCYIILSSSCISLLRVARLLLSDDKGGRLVANATKELRLPFSSLFFSYLKIW